MAIQTIALVPIANSKVLDVEFVDDIVLYIHGDAFGSVLNRVQRGIQAMHSVGLIMGSLFVS